MRTITIIQTNLSKEEVFDKVHVIMINNGFSLIPGVCEWRKGDGSLVASSAIFYEYDNYTIRFESFLLDNMTGEKGIESGFVGALPKVKLREILHVLINELMIPDTLIQGFIPSIKGKIKVNTNSSTLERQPKTFSKANGNLISACVGLGCIAIGWILIFATGSIYFYFPIFGIICGASALVGNYRHSKEGQPNSMLVITLAIITIILSILAFLMLI